MTRAHCRRADLSIHQSIHPMGTDLEGGAQHAGGLARVLFRCVARGGLNGGLGLSVRIRGDGGLMRAMRRKGGRVAVGGSIIIIHTPPKPPPRSAQIDQTDENTPGGRSAPRGASRWWRPSRQTWLLLCVLRG